MQIYHTSHCGSTLLASLLSSTITTYSEPSWCHKIIHGQPINFLEEVKAYENALIKFPSSLCCFSPLTDDKKIFLYRNLKNHLFKLLILDDSKYDYIENRYEFYLNHCHPKLKSINFDTKDQKYIFFWANRVFWMLESKNCFWVEANHFLSQKEKFLKDICNFLELKQVENYTYQQYDVKRLGFNNSDIEISRITPDYSQQIKPIYPSYGIVEDDLCWNTKRIVELIEWAKNNIDIPESFL